MKQKVQLQNSHSTYRTFDPEIDVEPTLNQIDDLLEEVTSTIDKGDRVLIHLRKEWQKNFLDTLIRLE